MKKKDILASSKPSGPQKLKKSLQNMGRLPKTCNEHSKATSKKYARHSAEIKGNWAECEY